MTEPALAIVKMCGLPPDNGEADTATVIPIAIEECKEIHNPLDVHHADVAGSPAKKDKGHIGSVDTDGVITGAV